MYVYYIRDDETGMYLIGRMKLGAPVPTCVWGERRADAIIFESAAEARKAVVEIGTSIASAYRLNIGTDNVIRLKSGVEKERPTMGMDENGGRDERPTGGRAEGVRTGCAARNPWPVAGEDRGRES